MKKLVALSLSASMMLAAAVPAFATFTTNKAIVKYNDVSVSANSGDNVQTADVSTKGKSGWGSTYVVGGSSRQEMLTGDAIASGWQSIDVGNSDCGCSSRHHGFFNLVKDNNVSVSANSGSNVQDSTVKTKGSSFGFEFDRDDAHFAGGNTTVVGGSSFQGLSTGNVGAEGWQIVSVNQ